jgi:hypothetical protein
MKFTAYYCDLMVTASLQMQAEKVSLTERKATYDKVGTVLDQGKIIASVTPTVLNQQLIEKSRGSWLFLDYQNAVDSKGKPLESDTWYHVNRKDGILEKIIERQADKLDWHERLYVYPSALDAIKEKRPLPLYVLYVHGRLGLFLLGGGYDGDDAARVAQVESSREKVAPIEQILRVDKGQTVFANTYNLRNRVKAKFKELF